MSHHEEHTETHHEEHTEHSSSTSPDSAEQQRVDDLPTGAGGGDEPAHQDPTSGGSPEQPDA